MKRTLIDVHVRRKILGIALLLSLALALISFRAWADEPTGETATSVVVTFEPLSAPQREAELASYEEALRDSSVPEAESQEILQEISEGQVARTVSVEVFAVFGGQAVSISPPQLLDTGIGVLQIPIDRGFSRSDLRDAAIARMQDAAADFMTDEFSSADSWSRAAERLRAAGISLDAAELQALPVRVSTASDPLELMYPAADAMLAQASDATGPTDD